MAARESHLDHEPTVRRPAIGAAARRRPTAVVRRPPVVEPKPAPPADARERGESPWLGRGVAPSETFLNYQNLERSLATLWPALEAALAPATAFGAFTDWATHLALSPAKQWELTHLALELASRGWRIAADGFGDVQPLPQDKRFADEQWQERPFYWFAQAFLLRQEWWQRATTGVPGVNRHHEQMVEFAARQWLDMVAPSNSVIANPAVLRRTLREAGANLLRGATHAFDDLRREAFELPPVGADQFQVGVDMAVTPGRVVLRNRLMELIQYAPSTPVVHPEPVLIVPAWIMKYYVLDLTPRNSLVKHLVDRGFTVFMISWKNPQSEDRDLGLEDYHALGVRDALEAVGRIVPRQPVHAVGYCLGGTLLAMAAAALGRERSKALKTMTLLAAQTDFMDPGEISLFIDESQVALLENQMWRRGYLDKRQMKHSFRMLRSRDLIWSYRLTTYLLGQRPRVNALMAWNADGTRLPFRMHSRYLRALFLDNALAQGEFQLEGVPINLADIRVPVFNVGTVQDHVAPWRSVFKLHGFTNAPQTFALTAGGHNVGIVNPPELAASSYRLREQHPGDRLLTPDEWLAQTPPVEGSWWTPWAAWLTRHSSRMGAPPELGVPGVSPMEAAPGLYVHQK
jgi:polyhydroxyalkanoate synthase